MKKIFKSRIFTFILGAILFGGIGVVSAYTIFANDIGYTPKDTIWKVDNVKDAIDDLYSKADNSTQEIIFCAHTWGNNVKGGSNIAFANYNYRKFKIKSFNYLANSNAEFYFTDSNYNTIPAEINKEYSLNESNISYLYITEQVNASYGYSCITLEFYN